MLESLLDEIPSLGEVRRQALLEKFGSVAALRKASVAEIAQIPGIGEKTADSIWQALSQNQANEYVDMRTGEIIQGD
jgi:excinuclease ABC subunit C